MPCYNQFLGLGVPMQYEYPSYNYNPVTTDNQMQQYSNLMQWQPLNYHQQEQQQQQARQQGVDIHGGNLYNDAMDISLPESDGEEEEERREETLPTPMSASHSRTEEVAENGKCFKISKAFKNHIATYAILNRKDQLLLEEFMKENINIFIERLHMTLCKHSIIKFHVSIVAEYIKIVEEDLELCVITHVAKMSLVTKADNIKEIFRKQIEEISTKMSEFEERDSGWTLSRIVRAEININKSSLVKDQVGYLHLKN